MNDREQAEPTTVRDLAEAIVVDGVPVTDGPRVCSLAGQVRLARELLNLREMGLAILEMHDDDCTFCDDLRAALRRLDEPGQA